MWWSVSKEAGSVKAIVLCRVAHQRTLKMLPSNECGKYSHGVAPTATYLGLPSCALRSSQFIRAALPDVNGVLQRFQIDCLREAFKTRQRIIEKNRPIRQAPGKWPSQRLGVSLLVGRQVQRFATSPWRFEPSCICGLCRDAADLNRIVRTSETPSAVHRICF